MASPEKPLRVYARVTVTLEIDLAQPWGPNSQLSEVWGQSIEEVRKKFQQILGRQDANWRFVGNPTVRSILVDAEVSHG